MVFDINGKVALITGGASGLGLKYAQELLKHGAKGVTLADINDTLGDSAVQEIEEEFGRDKAIFVKTDVTDINQFEDAFKKTVEKYNQIDKLFNNAGILSDLVWEKEVAINLNGTIHGVLLGLDNYLPKYKSGEEAVIVNISSIAGVDGVPSSPIYVGTKFAVHGMTLAWGHPVHFERTKVRVIALAPGVTDTPLMKNIKNLNSTYDKIMELAVLKKYISQTPEQMAANMIPVLQKAPTGTFWLVEGSEKPYQYVMPDRFKLENKVYID